MSLGIHPDFEPNELANVYIFPGYDVCHLSESDISGRAGTRLFPKTYETPGRLSVAEDVADGAPGWKSVLTHCHEHSAVRESRSPESIIMASRHPPHWLDPNPTATVREKHPFKWSHRGISDR